MSTDNVFVASKLEVYYAHHSIWMISLANCIYVRLDEIHTLKMEVCHHLCGRELPLKTDSAEHHKVELIILVSTYRVHITKSTISGL